MGTKTLVLLSRERRPDIVIAGPDLFFQTDRSLMCEVQIWIHAGIRFDQ